MDEYCCKNKTVIFILKHNIFVFYVAKVVIYKIHRKEDIVLELSQIFELPVQCMYINENNERLFKIIYTHQADGNIISQNKSTKFNVFSFRFF